MPFRDPRSCLFDDALELLRDADRIHRQFFTLTLGRSGSCWQPPVDVVEGTGMLTIRVALPGVPADAVQVRSDGASLDVIGVRPLDAESGDTSHRLEIPHGRFERRIPLPATVDEQHCSTVPNVASITEVVKVIAAQAVPSRPVPVGPTMKTPGSAPAGVHTPAAT